MIRFDIRPAALLLALALGIAACERGPDLPPPTEAEVRQAIETSFTETYLVRDFNAIPDRIAFEFGEIRIGDVVEKQMGLGEEARPVHPVKAPLDLTVTYSNNPTVRKVERGKAQNDVFFFYRDGFGEWTFRTGSM